MTIEYRYFNLDNVDALPDMILDEQTGQFVEVSGIDRIKQELIKLMLTLQGEDLMNPEYGSKTGRIFGAANIPSVTGIVATLVIDDIKALIEQQRADSTRTPEEIIDSIDDVTVNIDPENPRRILIDVSLTTVAGSQAKQTVPVTTGG